MISGATSRLITTSKSSFAYFHDADASLMRSIRTTLAEHNIEVRTLGHSRRRGRRA